ncbi:MAG: cytochrome P450 [Anaerolineae bacterium]|nr:cytochrome P450 [Anaerolineae bacterium]MDW8298132.1 cytochrome P450 [Anaerolineae bacterium]
MAVQNVSAGFYSPFLVKALREIGRKGTLYFFYDLWREYGDLVRIQIGRNVSYLVVHPDHVQQVNVTHRNKYDKRASFEKARKLLLGNSLIVSTGDLWKRQRRLLSPFFTPRGIEQYLPIFISEAQKLCQHWERLAAQGEPIEMIEEMMRLTAAIIVRTLFGTTQESEVRRTTHDVDFLVAFLADTQIKPFSFPLWVPTKRNRLYRETRARIHAYIDSLIAERRALPVENYPNDMLSKLMLARDEETGAPIPDDLIREEAITMFFAGHETTARGLAFAWYALASEPEVEAKLHAEIDQVLGSGTPTVETLKQLPYTLQVLKETMRLYPPAPLYVRDVVEEDRMAGQTIQAGAQIILMPYCTHRHPDFWHEPSRYDPDRFLPEQEAARHPFAFHPFAAGQRICIGNNFALLEMHVLLSMLAARFAPRLKRGHQVELAVGGTLQAKNGLWMHIVPR